jgi:hypothetical protein
MWIGEIQKEEIHQSVEGRLCIEGITYVVLEKNLVEYTQKLDIGAKR